MHSNARKKKKRFLRRSHTNSTTLRRRRSQKQNFDGVKRNSLRRPGCSGNVPKRNQLCDFYPSSPSSSLSQKSNYVTANNPVNEPEKSPYSNSCLLPPPAAAVGPWACACACEGGWISTTNLGVCGQCQTHSKRGTIVLRKKNSRRYCTRPCCCCCCSKVRVPDWAIAIEVSVNSEGRSPGPSLGSS